jgi:hypothetical protein
MPEKPVWDRASRLRKDRKGVSVRGRMKKSTNERGSDKIKNPKEKLKSHENGNSWLSNTENVLSLTFSSSEIPVRITRDAVDATMTTIMVTKYPMPKVKKAWLTRANTQRARICR